MFVQWIHKAKRGIIAPYNSCGNGSAMRIAPVGRAFETEAETLAAAKVSAECTHNHPEGIKGAQATALCIFLARNGVPAATVKSHIEAADFEDAIRNAISIGGDSDTIGCITGGIAEALFGILAPMWERGLQYLPTQLREVVEAFETKYGGK